ncbi:MAG: two component regulator propeller domain protein [Bacteroidota bacterium]|nr:two component regulator propeller domain protein [Bacteroidota bacterium]
MKTKKILLSAGLICLVAGSLIASNWTNFSNITKINQVAVYNNNVWVAATGGLLSYDKTTGAKTFFSKDVDKLPSLSVEKVVVNQLNGNVWIGTYDNGLAVYNGTSWTHFAFPDPTTMLYQLRIAANGTVWCATSFGLYKLENGQFTSYLANNSQSVASAWDIDLFPNGKILYGQSLPFIFDPATNQVQFINSTSQAYSRSKVLVKNDSVFYFATDHRQLSEFHDTTEVDTLETTFEIEQMQVSNTGTLLALGDDHSVYEKIGHAMNPVSFSDGSLEAFCIGDNNEKWGAGVNNDFGQLFHLNNSNQLDIADLRHTGIGSNWLYHLHRTEDNNVLIVHADSIQKFDLGTNTFSRSWKLNGFISNNGMALQLNGKLYVATSYEYFYEYSAGQWNQLGNGILPSPEVDKLATDNSGNLWLAGPGYLAKYDGTNFTLFTSQNAPVLTPNLYVRDILCDSTRNTVWVATYSGIIRYTGGVFSLLNDTNTSGIQQYYGAIETIKEDAAHNIWFGTVYGGVLKYDGNSFSTMLLPNTVGNQVVTSIEFIGSSMYVGDNLNGVWIYENSVWDSLNMYNSAISTNFVTSLLADRNGNLWIAGQQFGADVYNKNGVSVTSIRDVEAVELKVYPNPSHGRFFVETPLAAEISVYDISGKCLQVFKSNERKSIVDLSNAAPGMYIASIKTGSGVQMVKLINQ